MDDIREGNCKKITSIDQVFRMEILDREMDFYRNVLEDDNNLTEEDIKGFREDIRTMEKWRREIEQTSLRKIKRNEPCPCGSGRKYKKCCLNRKDKGPDQKRVQLTWEEAELEYGMLQVDGMLPMLGKTDDKKKIEALEEIIGGCPDFYPAIIDHGMQLMTRGRLDDTIKDLEKGFGIIRDRNVEPGKVNDIIQLAGHNLEKYFCYLEAIKYYEMIPDLDVDDISKSTAHSDIANCCFHIGDLDRALDEAQKAVSISPDHCKSLSNLGWIRMTRGELSSAMGVLEKAVEADPEDVVARGNLKACGFMMDNDLKDWVTFLLKEHDPEAIERMWEENDEEGAERERRFRNMNLLDAFRNELARDDSRTYMKKYDIMFTMAYAFNLFEEVVFDQDLIFSDIAEIESSMDRFLARLIVKTGDINDKIFDANIDAILEFYRFLESREVVSDYADLEEAANDLREDFREKMHAYNLARRTGDPDVKEKARDKLFGDLYWSY
jgi:tetratricopeptide (TPR) repeat protein